MLDTDEALIELDRLDDAARAILFTKGRTANSFSSRPVTGEQLQEIYGLMKWGPTWANTLPLRIVYVTSPEGKQRLLEHMNPGNVAKTASAPVSAVLAVDNRYHDQLPRLLPLPPRNARHAGGRRRLPGEDP